MNQVTLVGGSPTIPSSATPRVARPSQASPSRSATAPAGPVSRYGLHGPRPPPSRRAWMRVIASSESTDRRSRRISMPRSSRRPSPHTSSASRFAWRCSEESRTGFTWK